MRIQQRERMAIGLCLAVSLLTGCALLPGFNGGLPLCHDADVKQYTRMLRGHNALAGAAIPVFEELMADLRDNGSLIADSAWRSAVSDPLTAMVHASTQARLMRAPRQALETLHDEFLRSYDLFRRGALTIHDGLLHTDATTALQGFRTLEQGIDPFRQAQDALRQRLGDCPWYAPPDAS